MQGGVYENLRMESVKELVDMNFAGYAIGGLAVGEGQEMMFKTLDYTAPALPDNKPRYLMGVGKPPDLVGAVKRGVDMFDCVLPSRSGRNGQAFTAKGVINILPGLGTEAGQALVEHEDVDKIAFTGSVNVGKHIQRTAANTLKNVTLELGGKSANVILDDADI